MDDKNSKYEFSTSDEMESLPEEAHTESLSTLESFLSGQENAEVGYCPILICIAGSQKGSRYHLEKSETILGRSRDTDWRVLDSGASRQHVRIIYENWDKPSELPLCFIEDLDSRNGTELNGEVLRGKRRLVERDRLMIGRTVFGFFLRDGMEMRQEESLYNRATRDSLTGLANRRTALDHLEHHIARAGRGRCQLSMLILDLDHFKSVNDSFGHDIGDKALIHVARIIKESCRQSDLVARWGGEEFTVILPDSTPVEAYTLAERLREAVESNPIVANDSIIRLTISIGGTSFAPDDNFSTLFRRADQLLLQAKQEGRNRICFSQFPKENQP